jgi:hypothetical protein
MCFDRICNAIIIIIIFFFFFVSQLTNFWRQGIKAKSGHFQMWTFALQADM